MFEHSVKVPRHYKIAANIFKKVSTEGGSVKTLLYDDKLRHFRTNVLYALITETIKHSGDLDKIFESCNLLQNEPRLDPWIAKILATELLFGKKSLPGKSKPEQTISTYKTKFENYLKENADEIKTEVVRRPRYVRINTNMLTTSDAIRAFQDEEYKFIRCTSVSYDEYLKQVRNLREYEFMQDYHVKTVFVFPPGTLLHEDDLYLENKIILQDKATAMAVHLLSPPPGSVVLDMCAAPGMKTTQLAAYMRNQGKIYAVERDEKRFQTLRNFVSNTGSKCVETIHKDALEIKKGEFDNVEYILLDPSCSGSGMELCVHNYIEESRLAKLTSLQEKFLKHAMNAFPKAKRIVYSTCSLYPEENERVITNTVKTSRSKWRVQDVKELLKGQWNNIGSGMYGSMGTRCVYARPDSDLTTGFFLAVLDRDPKDYEKSLKTIVADDTLRNDANNKTEDKVDKKREKNDNEKEITLDEEDNMLKKKKKKKRKHGSEFELISQGTESCQDPTKYQVPLNSSTFDDGSENEVHRKTKKKKRKENNEDIGETENDNLIIKEKKSKKKKSKKQCSESS